MKKLNAQKGAQLVREELRGRYPGGLTIEVIEEKVIKIDAWWQVPVRPNFWPERTFEYHDTLAEVGERLMEARREYPAFPDGPAESRGKADGIGTQRTASLRFILFGLLFMLEDIAR